VTVTGGRGGDGGLGGATGLGGNGGNGGSATGQVSASGLFAPITEQATVTGGTGGNGVDGGYGGMGGAATYGNATAAGGTGGNAPGANGGTGGQVMVIPGPISVIGGKGGNSVGSGNGGNGADVAVTNAAIIPQGFVTLVQNVTAGSGGNTQNGVSGAAGNAMSVLTESTGSPEGTFSTVAVGGAGGNKNTAIGTAADGGSANAVTIGTSHGLLFITEASATGGVGGVAAGGANAGNGGAAISSSTENGIDLNEGDAAYDYAVGGAGGQVISGTGSAGNGGDATASASAVVNNLSQSLGSAFAQAIGGNGGDNLVGGIGGNGGGANAFSTITNNFGMSSTAQAIGGYPGVGSSLRGAALARADGGVFVESTVASAQSGGGLISFLEADASGGLSGAVEARAAVARQTPDPTLADGLKAGSYATGLPSVNDVLTVVSHSPIVAANFDIGGTSDLLGLLVLEGNVGSVTVVVQTAQLRMAQDLKVGFVNPVVTGNGFNAVTFRIIKQGITLVNTNFTDSHSAWNYFNNRILDFGPITNNVSTNLNLQFVLSANTSNNSVGFRTEIVFGNSSFYNPPVDSVGDGIPDTWRQQYFGGDGTATNGQSCAACDADGTGQDNFFKYIAALNPTNPASVFVLSISSVTNQPQWQNLVFNPVAGGRSYTPQFSTDLVSRVWAPLVTYTGPMTNNGNQVTITDANPISPREFYRIDISLP